MFYAPSRILYDRDFINASCPEIDYDPNAEVDDTVGTYATNFAIAAVAIVAFWRKCGVDPPFLSYFYLAVAVSFFIAGVSHIVVRRKDDEPAKAITEVIAYLSIGVSIVFLVLYGLGILGISKSGPKKWIWWTTAGVLSIAMACFAFIRAMLYIGLLAMAAYFFIIVLHIWKKTTFYAVKALGIATMLGSFVIQAVLGAKCGDAAYEDCFKNCPLKDPINFNHNALFHIIFMLGLMAFAWAEDYSASTHIEIDVGSADRQDKGAREESRSLEMGDANKENRKTQKNQPSE